MIAEKCVLPHTTSVNDFTGDAGSSSAPGRFQEGENLHHHHGHCPARRMQILLFQQDDHPLHPQGVKLKDAVFYVPFLPECLLLKQSSSSSVCWSLEH